MATNLLTFRPAGIRACAIPGPSKPDAVRQKSSSNSSSSSSSANWFAPLFGLSPEPDYIDSDKKKTDADESMERQSEQKPAARSKYLRGCLTEEKAKQLRMMTNKASSFHDIMYHSAIASRLASDFEKRPDL